ncbi:hypothetical protein Q31b_07170 [Novipirellula aureliae]|uniref:Lipoprotein n=1 Tax=Novipirellula aureliae TaxID=2527966 RepID=A0A5C6E7C2_9BACT|nr:hypothetical protein [Novipirellula aureliae]TWU45543.1 hypothetical protein Q31b_07170 [Novipirellula aureliae]
MIVFRHLSILDFRLPAFCLALVIAVVSGCGQLAYRLTNNPPETFVPNPLELPPAADDFVWSQVVDSVDDYFRIAREQPVLNSGGLVSDGRLETVYKVGSSLAQPWNKDSTPGFERLQASLQSVRRKAIVTVRPQGTAYVIEVVVQKDLEDTDRTQYATETTLSRRHDGTLIRERDRIDEGPQTLGWIPLGRDASLEQAILADIFGRITQVDGGGFLPHH